jgi:hypothetical protein
MPRIAGKSTLSFESTSGSLVYYEAYLRTAPKDPAELPFSHGLQVDKTYRLMSGSGGAASHFHVGDYGWTSTSRALLRAIKSSSTIPCRPGSNL